MPGVLLAGDLGARDPGDDALIAAFASQLPRWQLTIMSADPASTTRRHGRPAIDIRSPRAVLAAIRRCEVMVLDDRALRHRGPGAGRGERSRDVLGAAVAAKALGRRVALVGVGADHVRRRLDRVVVNRVVRWSDLLVLRDPVAARALASVGAPGPFRVGADPVWCALESRPPHPPRRDEVLVILDARVAGDPRYPARLAATLDLLAAHGLRIRISPWRISRHGADDLDMAREIVGQLGARAHILLPPASLAEAQAEATRARVVLALRLHAMIVGASADVPVLAVNGEPEMSHLALRLQQPAIPLTADPQAIAQAVLDAADGPAASRRAVAAERTAAGESFRLLRLLLDAEGSEEDHEVVPLPLVPAATGEPVL